MGEKATIAQHVEAALVIAAQEQPSVYKLVDMPLDHRFTPGLYTRKITMWTGMLVTSETHKTHHQWVLMQGVVSVWTEQEGEVLIVAPDNGETLPGTKRVIYVHEEAIWMTIHSTLFHTVQEIYDDIIEKMENPFLKGHYINNVFYPEQEISNQ